mgnify:CR=1 FL=1
MQVFAKPGESLQQVGGDCPEGWVVMEGQRPDVTSAAQADGTWAAPPAPVPASCTRRQGRLALLTLGLLDAAEAAIAGIADSTEQRAAQIEYEADTWDRGNAFVQQLWAILGGEPEGLDDAFRLAVTL